MDFTPTEEQAAARDLAARIFGDLSTPERLAAAGTGSDAETWKALCAAGLVAAVADTGLLGLVLLLEEQGRTTAQVPFAASCVYGLLAVSAHGSPEQRERLLPGIGDGTAVVCGAVCEPGGVRADAAGRLSGVVPVVPWATAIAIPGAPTSRGCRVPGRCVTRLPLGGSAVARVRQWAPSHTTRNAVMPRSVETAVRCGMAAARRSCSTRRARTARPGAAWTRPRPSRRSRPWVSKVRSMR
ncbi:acyl-CoA dehydrogenase family protein [Micrococcus luteus]